MRRAALYLRLSRDDKKMGESESIGGQKMYLSDYCEKNGFEIAGIYSDDGFSGTNFVRPAFIKMINDALSGLFDVIITKDMSRLGRDYIETGEYIERFFPENGIRYIAVNDGVDTGKDCGGNEMIAFRAVFNDMYAKDISKKVRTALDARRAAGKFIGSTAPFGYLKDKENKNRLVPDPAARQVVERIFGEFVGGKSMLSIAKSLTSDGIATPSALKNDRHHKSAEWNSVIIKRILSNPTYAGDLTQGFEKKVNYKSKKRIRIKADDRFVSVNTHEAIIDKKTFEAAAKRLGKYKCL